MKLDPTNKWLKGMNPETIQFEDQRAMLEAMSAPEYKTDASYRDVVSKMIENASKQPTQSPAVISGRDLSRAMYPKSEARKLEDAAILREQTAKMFGDPRYATSPTYRREVEEYIRANDAALTVAMGNSVIDRSATPKNYRVQLGTDSDAFAAGKESIRLARVEEAKAAAVARHAEVDQSLADDMGEIGGAR
jgi:hypothetical protein